MLSAQGLVKSFDGFGVLRGVSLQVARGEVVAVIGRSGSGKSTLLRCLNDLEKIDEGRIQVAGDVMVDTRQGGYANAQLLRTIRLKMGYVFQNFNLFPHLTVLRNVTQAQECVLRRSKQQARERAENLLQKVGLLEKKDEYPCNLSGGQQQRAAIARALALDPKILCFDEPTSALDPLLTQDVLGVIRALAREGHTMIVVTHEMAFAREVADRVLFMEDGQIILQGTAQEVFGDPRVQAFSGQEQKSAGSAGAVL